MPMPDISFGVVFVVEESDDDDDLEFLPSLALENPPLLFDLFFLAMMLLELTKKSD